LPFWWVGPAIVACGIFVSITLALFTIRSNRSIARQKATIDLIKASESESYYRDLYAKFRKFRMDEAFRKRVLDPETDADWDDRFACYSYLNHYELIAISFKMGILDEDFYKDWMGYAVVRDFREATALIEVARAPVKAGDPGDLAAYCYLESLCDAWENVPKLFFRPITGSQQKTR